MNRKYLEDGQEVELIQEVKGGFLVSYVFCDGEENEEIGEDKFVANKLYDNPPVEKYNAEISKLKSEIENLNAEKHKLENERKSLEKDTTYPEIFIMMKKFFEDKITHVIYKDEILTTEKYMEALRNQYYSDNRGINLYFSNWYSNNKPQDCEISGNAKFYETYNEALKELQKKIREQIYRNGLNQYIIEKATKYNVEMPAKELIEYKQRSIKKRNDEILNLRDKINKAEAEIKQLEEQNFNEA